MNVNFYEVPPAEARGPRCAVLVSFVSVIHCHFVCAPRSAKGIRLVMQVHVCQFMPQFWSLCRRLPKCPLVSLPPSLPPSLFPSGKLSEPGTPDTVPSAPQDAAVTPPMAPVQHPLFSPTTPTPGPNPMLLTPPSGFVMAEDRALSESSPLAGASPLSPEHFLPGSMVDYKQSVASAIAYFESMAAPKPPALGSDSGSSGSPLLPGAMPFGPQVPLGAVPTALASVPSGGGGAVAQPADGGMCAWTTVFGCATVYCWQTYTRAQVCLWSQPPRPPHVSEAPLLDSRALYCLFE